MTIARTLTLCLLLVGSGPVLGCTDMYPGPATADAGSEPAESPSWSPAVSAAADAGVEPAGPRSLALGWLYEEPGLLTDGIALGEFSDDPGPELVVLMEGTGGYCGAPHVASGKTVVLGAGGDRLSSYLAGDGRDLMGIPLALDVDDDVRSEYVICESAEAAPCHAVAEDSASTLWTGPPSYCAGSWNMGPSAGDVVSGPGNLGPEVVIADWNGDVRVLGRGTGEMIADFSLWEGYGTWANGHAAIADIDGACGDEIVIAGGYSGRVFVLGASSISDSLQPLYVSDPVPDDGYMEGSGPAVGDIDGDGEPEIVVSPTGTAAIYAYSAGHGTGCKYRWTTVSGGDYYWTSPVIGDVDGDGQNEVVVFSNDSVLSVLSVDGASSGECVEGVVEWEHAIDAPAAWFTPVLAQLTGGDGVDVVIASYTILEVVDVQARSVAYRFVDETAQFYPSAVVAPGPDTSGAPGAHIYVSGWLNGAVYRLDTAAGDRRPASWPEFMGGPERTGAIR